MKTSITEEQKKQYKCFVEDASDRGLKEVNPDKDGLQQLLEKGGEFAQGLENGREAALTLWGKIRADQRFITGFPPELDIIIWAPRAASVSAASEISRKLFAAAEEKHLYLALANLPVEFFELPDDMQRDAETVTCLRSVLMKPEHKDWLQEIWDILDQSAATLIP